MVLNMNLQYKKRHPKSNVIQDQHLNNIKYILSQLLLSDSEDALPWIELLNKSHSPDWKVTLELLLRKRPDKVIQFLNRVGSGKNTPDLLTDIVLETLFHQLSSAGRSQWIEIHDKLVSMIDLYPYTENALLLGYTGYVAFLLSFEDASEKMALHALDVLKRSLELQSHELFLYYNIQVRYIYTFDS